MSQIMHTHEAHDNANDRHTTTASPPRRESSGCFDSRKCCLQDAERGPRTIIENEERLFDPTVTNRVCISESSFRSNASISTSAEGIIESLLEDLVLASFKPAVHITNRDISLYDPVRQLRDPSCAPPPNVFMRKRAKVLA